MNFFFIMIFSALRGQIFKSVPASEMKKLFRTHSLAASSHPERGGLRPPYQYHYGTLNDFNFKKEQAMKNNPIDIQKLGVGVNNAVGTDDEGRLVVAPSKSGAVSGAAAGAALGTIVPGVGTAVGAAIGGAIGFLFGPAD